MRTSTPTSSKTYHAGCLKAGVAALAFGFALSGIAHAQAANSNGGLDQRVMSTVQECQKLSPSCATTTQNAAGILVFPAVIKADLIVGGSGGKGALIENGQITGYYSIGSASAGLQLGVDQASQVYVFRTAGALAHLKSGSDWKAGADADVTVVNANATAASTNGPILTYVFNSSGLDGGASVKVMDVWKTGQARPQYTGAPGSNSGNNTSNP